MKCPKSSSSKKWPSKFQNSKVKMKILLKIWKLGGTYFIKFYHQMVWDVETTNFKVSIFQIFWLCILCHSWPISWPVSKQISYTKHTHLCKTKVNHLSKLHIQFKYLCFKSKSIMIMQNRYMSAKIWEFKVQKLFLCLKRSWFTKSSPNYFNLKNVWAPQAEKNNLPRRTNM